jgi:hypothetical protein
VALGPKPYLMMNDETCSIDNIIYILYECIRFKMYVAC